MPRSKVEVYLHFVWSTYQRLPLVTPEIENRVYGAIRSEAERIGLQVYAIGGMPDHVHLVVWKPAHRHESFIMQRVKGLSSTIARQHFVGDGELFRWQEHYGVFSFHKRQLDTVIAYVRNQKEHHKSESLRQEWEETEEESPEVSGTLPDAECAER